jgi:hypothetical protein
MSTIIKYLTSVLGGKILFYIRMKSKTIYKYILWLIIYIFTLRLLLSFNTNINKNFIEAMTNKNVYTLTPIDTIDLSQTYSKKINNKDITFYSSNASIIEFPGKTNTYVLNIRFINYNLKAGISSLGDEPVISINALLLLNKEFKIQSDKYFDNNLNLGTQYIGLEDLRLYNEGGQLYYSATCYDNYSGKMKISNNMYIIKNRSLELVPNIITVTFETKFVTEKNWVYFNYLNETHLVYQWYPLKICKIVDNKLLLIETKEVPKDFEHFRGSSNGIKDENKIWFIVHIKDHLKYYYHHFVCFDENMNLIKYSKPFIFENIGIEYCMSFVIKNNQIIIPYTIRDIVLKLGIYDKNYLLNDIEYIYVNK